MAKSKSTNEPRVCLDGFTRTPQLDNKLSLDMAALFSSDLGREVLTYLRSITIESVNGPAVASDQLRHVEGQRYVVGIIQARIKHAHKVKENE